MDKAIDYLLNVISGRFGLDHDRVLGSRYAFPIVTLSSSAAGKFHNANERDRCSTGMSTPLWGRYAGSTESVLMRDLGPWNALATPSTD